MKLYSSGIISILLFIILLAISLCNKDNMTFIFVNCSYYIVTFLILLWASTAFRFIKSSECSLPEFAKQNCIGLVIAAVLTLVVTFSVKSDFRTLSDETNMLSTSNSFFYNKKAQNITSGQYYYDTFHIQNHVIPRRPFVFPIFTALVHSLTGFSAKSGFIVNHFVLFLFLSILFMAIKKYFDSITAVSGLFLFLSQPVITLFASSSGFDFINAFFLYLAFGTLLIYLEKPTDQKFSFLWTTLIMSSNIRYESILPFFITISGLWLFRYFKLQTIKNHFNLLCITPLLMLPYLLQRILMINNNENPPETPLFSLGHFTKHLKSFFMAQFDFSFYLPYASLLNIISFVCILYFFYYIIKKRKFAEISSSSLQFFIIFTISITACLCVILSFFLGDCTHPVSTRFYIPILILLAIVPLCLRRLHPNIFRPKYMLIFSIVMFLFYHPVAIEDRLTNTLTLNREFRQLQQFVDKLGDRRTLIIYHRPGMFTSMGYGAVKFSYFNTNSKNILSKLNKNLFSDIIVFQRIQYRDQKPIDGCLIAEDIVMHKIKEIQISSDFFIRISKI